jgi:hypothetical protein
VILAIDTLQVTMGKKNVADAFIAGNYRLFTLMNENGRDAERSISLAIAELRGKPVGIAFSRTYPASTELRQRL